MSVITTLFKSDNYRYDWDNAYGVGWYVRLSDDHCSLMNTGTEGYEESERWINWDNRRNVAKQRKNDIFDSVAAEHSFTPRWEDSKKGGV